MECAQTLFVDDILQFFIGNFDWKRSRPPYPFPQHSIATLPDPFFVPFDYCFLLFFFLYFVLYFFFVFSFLNLCALCVRCPALLFAGLC